MSDRLDAQPIQAAEEREQNMNSMTFATVVFAGALTGSFADGSIIIDGGTIGVRAWDGTGPVMIDQTIPILPSTGSNSIIDGTASASSNHALTDALGLTTITTNFTLDSGVPLGAFGESFGTLNFTVTQDVDYAISGLFAYTALPSGVVLGQIVVLLRTSGFDQIFNGTQTVFGADQSVTLAGAGLTGTLTPGQYIFEWAINGLHSSNNDRTGVVGNIGLSFAYEVPAPGSLALFALAGSLSLRRRR